LIISPYAKPGYISHTTYEHSSIVRFIEETFGLPNLGNRDTTANDTMDSFDFSQNPNPPLVLTPRTCPLVNGTMTFGQHTVGSTATTSFHPATQPLQIFNTSTTTALKVYSVTTTGDPDFKASGCLRGTVAPATPCNVNVTFVPTQPGLRSATITIKDSEPTSPHVTQVTGVGSDLSVQSMLFFGKTVTLGKKFFLTLPLTNIGTSPITISSVAAADAASAKDFIITSTTCVTTLAPGASCGVQVQFAPTVTGTRWGQINVIDTDPGSPHQVRLVGTGAPSGPQSGLSPSVNPIDESKELTDDGDDD
jgi:hypothetical protein